MSSSGKRVKLSQNFWLIEMFENIEKSLPELEGKNVLEIGGGDGKISEIILSKKPDNLSILELDRVYFEILKEKFSKFEM